MRTLSGIMILVLIACEAESKPGTRLPEETPGTQRPKAPHEQSPPASAVEPYWAYFVGPDGASEEELRRAAQGLVERAARDYTGPSRMDLVGRVMQVGRTLRVGFAIRGDRYRPSAPLIEKWSAPAAATIEIRFFDRKQSKSPPHFDLSEVKGYRWMHFRGLAQPLLVKDDPILKREDLEFGVRTEHRPVLSCVPSEIASRRIEAAGVASDRDQACLILDGEIILEEGFAWEPARAGEGRAAGAVMRHRFTFDGRVGLAVAHPIPFPLEAVARPERLAARFQSLIRAAGNGHWNLDLVEEARKFAVPEESTWFATSFGLSHGSALRLKYYKEGGGPAPALAETVRRYVASNCRECDVVSYRDNHQWPWGGGLWEKINPGRENPLAGFFAIEMADVWRRNVDPQRVFFFAVVEGEWRYVGSLDR